MRGNNRQGIASQRRLERAMRRRSRVTSTRGLEPRIGNEPDPGEMVLVRIPVAVGACLYGQLVAFREVRERNGFEAFRVALQLQFGEVVSPEYEKFRAQLMQLGASQFARVWHLLVAYVDRVGPEVARVELNRGLFYRRPLDA